MAKLYPVKEEKDVSKKVKKTPPTYNINQSRAARSRVCFHHRPRTIMASASCLKQTTKQPQN